MKRYNKKRKSRKRVLRNPSLCYFVLVKRGGDDPSNLIDNNNQNDTEEEFASKDTSGDSGFEKDEGNDSSDTSELVSKQRTEDEEVEGSGISRLGDAGRANSLPK